jgi:5-methylcytosine-specific restriction endonuclease McrA
MTHNRRKYLWKTLTDLYGPICFYCKRDLKVYRFDDSRKLDDRMTIDHLWPVSKGGKHELGNTVLACLGCNGKKGSKTYDEITGIISFGLA